jgi:2-hydroxy-6-oxonona-2,4-dienedioate hydrolase
MSMPEPKFIDVDGIRTRYFDVGEGEVIVLLHGSNFGADLSADCAVNWSRNIEGLSRHARVIALDRLGQGLTDNPPTLDRYTMDAVIEHAAGFVRALGVAPVHIVGHSRGGFVACRLTLDFPDLVKTCVIIDSLTLAPGRGRMHEAMVGLPSPRPTRETQQWVLQRYSYRYDHIETDWLDALNEVADLPKYKRAIVDVGKSRFAELLAKSKIETLEELSHRGLDRPTLVIWSFNDPTATIEQGWDLYRLIAARERRAHFHVLNESGHFTYREHPAEFNATLLAWVEMWE